MRLVYLDEAGVSSPAHEPFLVVAGVIIDADQDWKRLDWHLRSLARKYLPEGDRHEFVFHAHEIWHGSGYWDRQRWPRETRVALLRDMAAIPARFHLPIVVGAVDRLLVREKILTAIPKMPTKSVDLFVQAQAFMLAVQDVDTWMTANAPREAAMLVAENTGRAQALMKLIHNGYRDWDGEHDRERVLAAPQVIDTVHFAAKDDSPLLQLADTVAFLIKRRFQEKADITSLYMQLEPQLVCRTRDGTPDALPGEKFAKAFRVTVPRSAVVVVDGSPGEPLPRGTHGTG